MGPALEHYRCFKCYIPKTGGIQVSDTVKFFPHDTDFPSVTMHDQFLQALSDIFHLLQQPDHDLPFLKFGYDAKNVIAKLATILKTNLQPNLPSAPTSRQLHPPPRVEMVQPPRVAIQLPKTDKALTQQSLGYVTPVSEPAYKHVEIQDGFTLQ